MLRLLLAATAGFGLGYFVLALLRANGPDPVCPACEDACPRCHGAGAFVEIVDATQRPRTFFCTCRLGEAYAAQAAGPVDFDIVAARFLREGGAS